MKAAVEFFRRRFAAAGSAGRAKYERAYMKSALKFHGVDAATVRGTCAEFCKAHALDHDALVAVVDALYATDWFDLHSAGVGVLEHKRKLVGVEDAAWLIGLVRASACWAHVDWLATKIVPHALPPKPRALLRAWARDDDFWVRRTALLAQPMLGEKGVFIRKAIGWILRDTSKKRPQLVHDFVAQHRARMSGLTFREATRRLPEKLRASLV